MKKIIKRSNIDINLACYFTMVLLGLYLAGYQNAVDSITKEYSISSAIMGAIIALHFIGSITSPVVFGEISDRKGTKIVTLTAFVFLIIGLLAVSLIKNIYILALGIFLIGCGFSVIEGTLSTVLSNNNPGHTVKVINMSQMFFCIGAVLSPIFTLFIMKRFGSWKYVFIILTFLFFFMAVIFFRFDLDKSRNKQTKNIECENKIHSFVLLKQKSFILLCLAMFIYVGVEEGIAFWMTTFFGHTYNSTLWGSYALSAYWAGMVLGRFFAALLPEKGITFLKIGTILTCFSILLVLLTENKVLGFVSFALVGLGFSVTWPMIVSITSEKFHNFRGTAIGIMMSLGALGGTVFPFLIGIFDNFGKIRIAFWIIPILVIMLLIAILSAVKKMNKFCIFNYKKNYN